jgi:flagellum-specific peptidoglycan hydrolase FlgJ
MNQFSRNIDIIASELGLTKLFTSLLLSLIITMLISINLMCIIIINRFNPDGLEVPVYSEVVDFEDEPEFVHATRKDKSIETTYSKVGTPTTRKWLTVSEWQGKHLTDSTSKSLFKTWKLNETIKFVDYIKLAAKNESSVPEYNKIPPSLTAAQAIIESMYGKSRLAVDANNIFGHKCFTCQDSFIIAHDDDPNDRFSIKQNKWYSLRDHSKMLMRLYYPRLKNKSNPDIRDWLDALCNCGRELDVKKALEAKKQGKYSYATSCYTGEGYAVKIMKYIKLHKLNELDDE